MNPDRQVNSTTGASVLLMQSVRRYQGDESRVGRMRSISPRQLAD
jgi:hypothetical protein